ncbi:MAG: cytosine permease [Actinomycetes bacterium]
MESSYQPPVRKSLSDEELAARVNLATSSHSGIEAVMELLVAQEALRAQEDSEIALWVIQMENDGSPEANRALDNFRRNSQGLEPMEETLVEPVTDAHLVQEVEETVEVIEEVKPVAAENPFSWFLRTNETPVVKAAEQIEIVEEAVVEEAVVEEADIEELVIEVVQEETVVVTELHPEGSETADAFDQLLAAASAEEEVTALEEVKQSKKFESVVSNVVVPSDEHRDRKASSQIFAWLGASATLVPLLLVTGLIGFGLSADAILTDLIIGYLVSGTLVATAALAGKRSGLSTSMVSRAVFGVWGNSIPLSVLFLVRAVITALILTVFTLLLDGVEARLPLFDTLVLSLLGINFTTGLLVQILILTFVALLTLAKGFTSRVIQLILSSLALVLIVESFVGLPFGNLKLAAPGQLGIMSKESFAGMALVVMVTLTLWFALAPNLAKSIPMKERGVKVFGFVLISNFVLPLLVAVLGLLWLGSSSTGLIQAAASLPKWSSGALVSGVALSLIYITLLSLKSAALDVLALVRVKTTAIATLLSFVAVVILLVLFAQQPIAQKIEYLLNVFVLAAALLAGWIGMFAADVGLRKIAYHELSLSRSYGFYKKFNVLSVVIWLVTVFSAVALMPVDLRGLSFFGFALPLIGLDANLGSAALGFAITVLVGIILTVASRIPQIRKQESEVLAVESRREQLNDIFVGQE